MFRRSKKKHIAQQEIEFNNRILEHKWTTSLRAEHTQTEGLRPINQKEQVRYDGQHRIRHKH